jgi:hypothetical protein
MRSPSRCIRAPTTDVSQRIPGSGTSPATCLIPPGAGVDIVHRFGVDPGNPRVAVGTALGAPPKPIAALLPPAAKWKAFFKREANNPKYLQHGDIMELSVATDDGTIDLGIQRTAVRYA